jgi:hypothetical protein
VALCFVTIVTFFVAILFRTGREHNPPGAQSDIETGIDQMGTLDLAEG